MSSLYDWHLIPDALLEEWYISSAVNLANELKCNSECRSRGRYLELLQDLVADFELLEQEYSRREFRTLPLEEFLSSECALLLEGACLRRSSNEEPVLYAPKYAHDITVASIGQLH